MVIDARHAPSFRMHQPQRGEKKTDLRNGKPVNFVPVIAEDLDFWFKKDSLWYSEDLDAVQGGDAGGFFSLALLAVQQKRG